MDEDLLRDGRALLDAFRAGDATALAQVFRAYVPEVAAFLRRGIRHGAARAAGAAQLPSEFDVESAVQEVFVRAFQPRARAAYDGLRPYRHFLFGIARHVALDLLRSRYRAEIELPEELGLSETPEEELERQRDRAQVAAFLSEECDDRDRALYQVRFEKELSQEDAARAARLTRIQIRRWEVKFRARLVRYLKRVGYVP